MNQEWVILTVVGIIGFGIFFTIVEVAKRIMDRLDSLADAIEDLWRNRR